MNTLAIHTLVIVFLYVAPILGVVLIIREIHQSRRYGTDLDTISRGISSNLEILRRNDIAAFDGLFSNWLEKAIRNVNTDLARVNLRLLIEAKVLGLGEGHREMLVHDAKYRRTALMHTTALAKAFDMGDKAEIATQMGNLFSLFLCRNQDASSDFNPRIRASEALRNSANRLSGGFAEALFPISDEMQEISKSGNPNDSGLSLLALQWAKLRLVEKGAALRVKGRTTRARLLQRQFRRIASYLCKENTEGVFDVIAGTV